MSSSVMTLSAPAMCPHGGPAIGASSSARVRVLGAPVLRASDRMVVAGCSLPPPAIPCLTVRLAGATRVRVEGQPVAITVGAVGERSGAPALIVDVQRRVLAT